MSILALIYLQPGSVPEDKQTAACMAFALAQGWAVSIVRAGALDQALRLIRQGFAEVVLLSHHDERAPTAIEDQVIEAGGRVEFCTHRHPRARRQLGEQEAYRAALRMHDLGAQTDEIVQLLPVDAGRLRDLLRRRRL